MAKEENPAANSNSGPEGTDRGNEGAALGAT